MKLAKLAFDLERAGIVAGLVGFVLLIAGISFIYWPAGLITAGLLLLAWSALAARAAAFAKRNDKDAG
ncbi:MAG TPA: hypothetical protein VJ654_02975 [Noviherbaspirillum sp.]|nr:hypothetical protein [Noviherbaspirillum sp.]